MFASGKGFTLLELMIAIAIIALLVAIAVPNFLSARGKAQDAGAQTSLKAIKTSLEMYAATIGNYPLAAVPSALSAAMGGTSDWPSNIRYNDGGGATVTAGTLTDYSVGAGLDTFSVTAKGRDASHYFHLDNDGAFSGPDASDTAAAP